MRTGCPHPCLLHYLYRIVIDALDNHYISSNMVIIQTICICNLTLVHLQICHQMTPRLPGVFLPCGFSLSHLVVVLL